VFSELSVIFKVIIIIIIYVIIFFALRIMYKDLKGGGRQNQGPKHTPVKRKKYGLEVININPSDNLKIGSVIMISGQIVIGRKDNNDLILSSQYVSGTHARVFLHNDKYLIEDLQSTNGTFLNGERLEGKAQLSIGDTVSIGEAEFKVIG